MRHAVAAIATISMNESDAALLRDALIVLCFLCADGVGRIANDTLVEAAARIR